MNCSENPKSLSEVLSANASDVVVPSLNLRLRDVLPRRPRIFMSHTFSGDGTGECCQRIKSGLQERLLCTVWFDKAEMGWTDAFIDEMKRGMANASAFVICLSPLYLTRPNCLRELMWAMDMCAADKTKKLCVLPMHPSVSFAGCRAIVDLATAGCAAQVVLPVDDRCKDAPTQLKQLKGHKLSDVAVSLLERLTGTENVGINAEWLKLQPWRSDAEGENWEETSQPWAGPCEGKSVVFEQLLDGLCVDVQAAAQAAAPPYPLSAFANVKDHELQSLPPSQEFQTPCDPRVLESVYPQLLLNFPEDVAVRLMLLGLRDRDAVDCMVHGVKKDSAARASQPNPVDQVFRMAADMSRCFTSSRSPVSPVPPAPAALADVSAPSHPLAASSSSSPPAPALHALVASSGSPPADAAAARSVVTPPSADGASEHPEADHLALKLREIKISDNAAVLADMTTKLRRAGIFGMEDLQGLSLDELKEAVAALNLNAVQLRRLFAAVPNI